VDIARMLIEHGADPTAQNKCGEASLHLESAPPLWAQNSRQKYAEVARILLEHGADVNAKIKVD
jgi:hypothetical protein